VLVVSQAASTPSAAKPSAAGRKTLGENCFNRDNRDKAMARIPTVSPPAARDSADPSGRSAFRPSLAAGLYVVSTPIGNLSDVTHRAIAILGAVELVLAEDTRVTRKLFSALGIKARLAAYHDHSGPEAGERALSMIAEGRAVALVSDAGTPLVSDPGYRLVADAIARGLTVIPVPGPSAAIAALSASGLPSDRFMFVGFAPSKAGPRRAELLALANVPATLIFFESGPRLADCLAAMAEAFGDRPAVVAREITKLFEEFRRGPVTDLAAHYAAAGPPKGEIVVLVGPPAAPAAPDMAEVDAALLAALESDGVKAAAKRVAAQMGLSATVLYARAQALKDGS
jgi:16S rRNA (cytidine1402-2'-O)-methyltransferase